MIIIVIMADDDDVDAAYAKVKQVARKEKT